MELSVTQIVADYEAHQARVSILGFDLGRGKTRAVLRVLQALRLYPKA